MEVFKNNKSYIANDNETIIELTDRLGIHIPRFCYHKHLSVVASCRMCLVEVEGFSHAQPACSTKLIENMKIHTKSDTTKKAQKATMEFLLINHPLDCPFCDQGGECELQDISLEFGDDHSQYMQMKRVVPDRDISPLISTDMTRCIHCSRCVRFGEEISACKELGLLDRGEEMKIDTFLDYGVSSELSGNMIELCPVGALNNKPYRYSARTWDLSQHVGISPHDCIGSNIYYHVYKNKIVRAVPCENESINQTWLSDRDRFGYEGIYSNDRIRSPMIRKNNKLIECDWETALDAANTELKKINHSNVNESGCLISPQSTCEELYLFQKLFKGLNIKNIDHRTKERDFSYQDNFPAMPLFGCNFNMIDSFDNIVLVGVNIKKEFPILSPRLIKATRKKTKVFSFNFIPSNEDFPVEISLTHRPEDLLSIFMNLLTKNKNENMQEEIEKISKNLIPGKKTLVIVGPTISQLDNQTEFHSILSEYSNQNNFTLGFLADQCNSTSSWLLGLLPHRNLLGEKTKNIGLNAYEIIENRLSSYIIYNLEPEYDFWNNLSLNKSLEKSKMNIFFSTFFTPSIREHANILFPIASFAEAGGSYINIEGTYQHFDKIINPDNNVKPGYEILNELLHKNNLGNYTFQQLKEEIEDKIINFDASAKIFAHKNLRKTSNQNRSFFKITDRSIYHIDSLSRRSDSLQMTKHAQNKSIKISKDIIEDTDRREYIEIIDKHKTFKTNAYDVDNSLPHKTIVYPSTFCQDTLTGMKSGSIDIKTNL